MILLEESAMMMMRLISDVSRCGMDSSTMRRSMEMMRRLVAESKLIADEKLRKRSIWGVSEGNEAHESRNESRNEMEMLEMLPRESVASESKVQQWGMWGGIKMTSPSEKGSCESPMRRVPRPVMM